jgi:hypothetical protein
MELGGAADTDAGSGTGAGGEPVQPAAAKIAARQIRIWSLITMKGPAGFARFRAPNARQGTFQVDFV